MCDQLTTGERVSGRIGGRQALTRLRDPRFYGVTEKQLRHVEVKTKFCPTDFQDFEKEWTTGVRRLKQYGGSISGGTLHADEDGNLCGGWASMSQFLSESDTDSD